MGKLYLMSNGNLHIIKCKNYSEVARKDKLFILNGILFVSTHVTRKLTKILKLMLKKGDHWYYSKVCKHAKNQNLFNFHNHESVVAQVTNGMARKKVRKIAQFTTISHMLQQGHPMLEYEAMKPLFEFITIPKNNKKH